MSISCLKELEAAICKRNPLLAERLQPGLPEAHVRRALQRAKLTGSIDPIVTLFSWKNGCVLDEKLALSETGFFPGDIYQFIEMDMAVGHLGHLKETAKYQPRLSEGVGRYFPLFWDGATGWLAVDVEPGARNRVMIIDCEDPKPFHNAYDSFDEFVADAIRANVQNDRLVCFQSD